MPGAYRLDMAPDLTPSDMQRAFCARDAAYDGLFLAGVRTTGIFCKPSCPAKRPNPENVQYFCSVRDALFAGFRPCKRCRPMDPSGQVPEWATELRDAVEVEPQRPWSAADLRARRLSPETVRRWFLKTYGFTFAAWCRALRLGQAFTQLREGGASGGSDPLAALCGDPEGKSTGGAAIIAALIQTPLGPMVAAAMDEGLCLLEFSDRRMLKAQFQTLARRLKGRLMPGDHPHLEQLRKELEAYFQGGLRTFTVPLHVPGTPFQEAVWHELQTIPHGRTITYESLAARAGRPNAIRAAGHANGMNRVSILIPCHRVVDKDGGLCGYGGGLWRKQLLLELERTGKLPQLA